MRDRKRVFVVLCLFVLGMFFISCDSDDNDSGLTIQGSINLTDTGDEEPNEDLEIKVSANCRFDTVSEITDFKFEGIDGPDVDITVRADGYVSRAFSLIIDPENDITIDIDPESSLYQSLNGSVTFVGLETSETDIFKMDIIGGNLVNLTDSAGVVDEEPRFSADGSRIVFTTSSVTDAYDIVIMDADGTNKQVMTTYEGTDRYPEWGMDDSYIIFTSDRSGNEELWMLSLDDSQLTQLTNTSSRNRDASWNETSDLIVFSSDREGTFDLYVQAAEAEAQAEQITDGSGDELMPRWSPDGADILYWEKKNSKNVLRILNYATSEDVQISSGCWDDFGGDWSPDGQYIVFWSLQDNESQLYVTTRQGDKWIRISDLGSDLKWRPDWKPQQ